MKNGVMMQYFEWYLPADGTLWKNVAQDAKHLAEIGLTSIWLPPAYKGQAGMQDVGYGVYDVYDLGEFNQKGTIPTKYGTKDEYLAAIRALQQEGIQVYADIVLNHKMGADGIEQVAAVENNANDRNQVISGQENIEAWTKFDFPGRHGVYSDFTWNHTHFDGVDWDQRSQKSSIYNFVGSTWDGEVDKEHSNYDYLMGADLSFQNQEVLDELDRFGQWYLDMTGVNGFRLDAVKHIRFTFFRDWLKKLREHNKQELFAVGEYWSRDRADLEHYLNQCEGCMSLFDVPLHFNFHHACYANGTFDMSKLLEGSLVEQNPGKAVTFVENHDTQEGQALQSVVADWFVPLAYAVILLRPQGYPCIFYGNYYGVAGKESVHRPILDLLLKIRRENVYGAQHDYFDHPDIVGWTLEGDEEHPLGVAVLITDGPGGEKCMYIGKRYSGKTFYDATGNQKNEVTIDDNGNGIFTVAGGNLSVWICKMGAGE